MVDPQGRLEGEALLPGVSWMGDAYEAAEGADAMVILTEWNEFHALDLTQLANTMKTPRMADLRNIHYPHDAGRPGFEAYVSVVRRLVLEISNEVRAHGSIGGQSQILMLNDKVKYNLRYRKHLMGLLALALSAPLGAAVASPILATATGLFGIRVVLSKVGMHGRLSTQLYGIFERLGWPIQPAV